MVLAAIGRRHLFSMPRFVAVVLSIQRKKLNPTEPFVGNGLGLVIITEPDG